MLSPQNKKGADFRHTPHSSPQTIIKYGKAAPVFGAVPILMIALCFGGDCEAIEQICPCASEETRYKYTENILKIG
ncbi:hypothetical protein [Hoylesella oralis]|uniref:hypothetical protein n=1 Tax=Hoylesella oralis TaxID=28134 RepID=UPI0028EB17B3|nr:hypothetical protein [Hoylesella oralis]